MSPHPRHLKKGRRSHFTDADANKIRFVIEALLAEIEEAENLKRQPEPEKRPANIVAPDGKSFKILSTYSV